MNTSDTMRRFKLRPLAAEGAAQLMRRQWLVTNGLGGYASGTISGAISWRYHGLLVAALPAYGRVVMLNHITESVQAGRWLQLGDAELPRDGSDALWATEFRSENLLPSWRYEAGNAVIDKQLLLLHGQNTVMVIYRLISGPASVPMRVRPFVDFRGHDEPLRPHDAREHAVSIRNGRYEISSGELPPLRLQLNAEETVFVSDGGATREVYFEKEAERGYEPVATLWSPGYFQFNLTPNRPAAVIGSTESWQRMSALDADEALLLHNRRCERLISLADPRARNDAGARLVLAADQFIVEPAGRTADAARANAAGDEVRTVIAGYHWFTDWGRDTMISLEGLTLATGRFAEAAWILRMFATHIRDGLIPNLFPEGQNHGLYHTADATLWFFHALDRYLAYTNDRQTLRTLLPKLEEIIERHADGTRFGIHADPGDGLLVQGEAGYQLTWMDAKVEGWVVTPRRGKAVEINALWYNALRLMEEWERSETGDSAAAPFRERAERAQASFNRRFWYAPGNHLYDVVDGEAGDDPACRPNQVIALSLKHPVADRTYWKPILETARARLLTPVGLRSLSPEHRDFKSRYFGDLRARDAAYHQGTVWAWLIGPFIDAWLRTFPEDRAVSRDFLTGLIAHLDEGCVGSINEIFDANAPFTPRGCIAQAWSVAEALRCWIKLADRERPANL